MTRGRATGLAAMALAALALAGCTDHRAEWAQYESYMRAQGKLRTDYDPADAPFTKADLIRNFEKVAFHSEYSPGGGATLQETPVTLSKMRAPLRWELWTPSQRPEDLADLRRLMDRIGALTALNPQYVPPGHSRDIADMVVVFADASDRAALLEGRVWPALTEKSQFTAEWLRDEHWPCMGIGGARPDGPDKGAHFAMAFIRDELDGVNRRSCIEEEVIQSLGLMNDGNAVRPSMFNDDEEFALMTRHDELLLQILYDPRLKAGMTAQEGMPIVRVIVAEMDLAAGADPARAAQAGGGAQ